jgi:hypothetical protein
VLCTLCEVVKGRRTCSMWQNETHFSRGPLEAPLSTPRGCLHRALHCSPDLPHVDENPARKRSCRWLLKRVRTEWTGPVRPKRRLPGLSKRKACERKAWGSRQAYGPPTAIVEVGRRWRLGCARPPSPRVQDGRCQAVAAPSAAALFYVTGHHGTFFFTFSLIASYSPEAMHKEDI